MATGFMFQIVNNSQFEVTFASSNYSGTDDISPFNVTVPQGGTAPGAPQNPGYYYFERSALASIATFDVTATAIGLPTPATLTVSMYEYLSMAPSSAPPDPLGPLSIPQQTGQGIPAASTTIPAVGGGIPVSVAQGGTTGKDNWIVGTIQAG